MPAIRRPAPTMSRHGRRRPTTVISLLTALIVLLGLTGCISGGQQNQQEQGSVGDKYSGEIEWWTINLQKNYAPYINSMIEQYQSEHPDVKIKWVDVPGQDITSKLLAAIASGQVPDAVNFNSQTMGLFGGQMTDLNELFTPDELGTYQESLRTPLTDGNRQAAIPWYNGGARLGMYRKSVVGKVGFDPAKPPTTFDDALELAQRVHDSEGISGTNLLPYSSVMQVEGIEMLNADRTQAAFNTPEAAALLEKYKKFYDSGAIAPGAIGKDERSYEQTLENGQIAFSASVVSTQLNNLQKNDPQVYDDIAVAAAVTGPDHRNLLQAQQVFGIPAKSDAKAAAAEWLKFVTSPANQLAFCKLAAIYPSTPETMKDPFFTQIEGDAPAEQARRIMADSLSSLEDGSLGTGNDENLRLLFDEQVRAYVTGSKSATDALDTAAKQWNDELAKKPK